MVVSRWAWRSCRLMVFTFSLRWLLAFSKERTCWDRVWTLSSSSNRAFCTVEQSSCQEKKNVLVRTPPSNVWFNRFKRLLWFAMSLYSEKRSEGTLSICSLWGPTRISRDIHHFRIAELGCSYPSSPLSIPDAKQLWLKSFLYTCVFIYLRRSLGTRFECVVHIWIPGIHALICLKASQMLSHCKKYLDVCHLAQRQESNGIYSYAEEPQW